MTISRHGYIIIEKASAKQRMIPYTDYSGFRLKEELLPWMKGQGYPVPDKVRRETWVISFIRRE